MARKLPILFTVLFIFSSFFANSQTTPTWSDNIACIVYSHCSNCHNSGGIAPFNLLSYNDAYNERFSIQYAVEQKSMPPWQPNDAYSTLAHNKSLSAEEIQLITDWVNAGAPEGDPNNAPSAPVFVTNEQITNPDLVLRIPTYTIPQISEDLYRCFVIPTGTSATEFITGVEVVPGNRSVVHHVLFYVDTTGQAAILDANDPGEGYTSFGGTGVNGTRLIGGWVPGSSPAFSPDGMGSRLPANCDIIVQMHYPYGTSGQVDSTKINFEFSESPTREVKSVPFINHVTSVNEPLHIPADSIKEYHAQQWVPFDMTLLSISPHAHLICEYMKAYFVTPTNDTVNLIEIPNWDFHWQGAYQFPSPIRFPAGSTFHGIARYNNTNTNPNNPNFPPQDVHVGEATTDEMLIFYFSYLAYQSGDENIVVDEPGSHIPHYQDCEAVPIGIEDQTANEIKVSLSPNPTNDLTTIFIYGGYIESYELIDMHGRLIYSEQVNTQTNTTEVNTSNLAKGCYYVRIVTSEGMSVKKLMIN